MPLYYFAYGSNLHPLRIGERIPSARFVGTSSIARYRFTFSKRGADQSGKGHIHSIDQQTYIFGAIYKIEDKHKQTLDVIEGPGYAAKSIAVKWQNRCIDCFAYIGESSHLDKNLKPFHWYKSLVVLGAQFHQLPDEYIRILQQADSMEDPDVARRRKNEALISRIKSYNSPS